MSDGMALDRRWSIDPRIAPRHTDYIIRPVDELAQYPFPQCNPEKLEEKFMHPPNNPCVPPTGDTCYINNLPPELLSQIFGVGALDDDDGGAYSWLQGCDEGLHEGSDNNVEKADNKKVELADQGGEEDEGDEEDRADIAGPSGVNSPSPPFQIVVSHVCRHWWNIALSTPSLWTTIEVPFGARPPYENVSIFLERSKALPIDIYIDCDPGSDYADSVDGDAPSENDLKFLFSLLVPHVQRWRSIKFEVSSHVIDSSHQMYTFLSAGSDPSVPAASQLATLQLYHYEAREWFETIEYPKLSNHFTLFGGSAPNLTELTLWGVHVDWDQGWIASASNLRCLKLAWHRKDVRPTWAQFATILRGAPQLESLVLYTSGPPEESAEWVFEPTPGRPTGDLNAPIQLLNLTDFALACQSPSHAIGLFRKFYMPSLKSLTLYLEGADYIDLINQLAGPTTSLSAQEEPRSLLSNLETLKIDGLPCSSEGVETLYSELQNLQSLNISESDLLSQFVDHLCQPCTSPGRGDIWLPRFKSLWICNGPGDLIRQVVQKRKDAGVPLKALYVAECDVGRDDVEWFRENVETFDFFDGSQDDDDGRSDVDRAFTWGP